MVCAQRKTMQRSLFVLSIDALMDNEDALPCIRNLTNAIDPNWADTVALSGHLDEDRVMLTSWLSERGIRANNLFTRPTYFEGTTIEYRTHAIRRLQRSGHCILGVIEGNLASAARIREVCQVPVLDVAAHRPLSAVATGVSSWSSLSGSVHWTVSGETD